MSVAPTIAASARDEAPSEPESRQRSVLRRALTICALTAFAVVQPLLDLFGNNPEFFVAGDYSRSQIVLFVAFLLVVPPLLATTIVAAATAVSRRAGDVAYAVVVTILGAALVLVILRTLGVDPLVLVLLLAGVGGLAIWWLVSRTQGGRLLASYLAAANVLFAALFIFASPASKLLASGGGDEAGSLTMPELDAPVIVLILDEFPAATIMRGDGSVNAERYPGFAALASVSTWFRNASSQYNLTHQAVPAVLDGRLATAGSLPIAEDHPRNMFSAFGPSVPIHRYESVTDLCPERYCDTRPAQPFSQLLEDASVVYGHRALPGALRDDLPAIDASWGDYGTENTLDDGPTEGEDGTPSYIEQVYARWKGLDADEKSPLGQAAVLREHIDAITGVPALHVAHVALPHRPWRLSRTGISSSYLPQVITDPDDPAAAFEHRLEFQLHSMQVGAADALVGELLDRLQELPEWEDTLLVVTSDHGTNLTPPDIGRMKVTEANREEVYRIPLFIKAPGQVKGEVRDDPAQNIDVLPSMLDLVGAETDWEFDGHSLFDGSPVVTPPKVSADVEAVLAIAAARAEEFPHGDDWVGLAAVGPHGDLVGREVADFTVGERSAHTIEYADADLFDALPTARGTMPFALHGTVHGPNEPPSELVVAINGRIAGVIGGYAPDGSGWEFLGYVADLYRTGANDVTTYEVLRDGAAVTLRPVEPA